MIKILSRGNWNRTNDRLRKILRGDIYSDLDKYGVMGVTALANSTPKDTGLAARSWRYRIIKDRKGPRIEWYNTDIEGGAIVVLLIQYGHGTGTGGYVQGRDFINPSIKPVFDFIAEDIWKKVRQ